MPRRYAARRAVLMVPPLRRYDKFASKLAVQHEALQREHANHSAFFESEKANYKAALSHVYSVLDTERAFVSQLTIERADASKPPDA